MQPSPIALAYGLPPIFSGIASALLALLIWRRRPSRPVLALSLYLASVALWSVAYSGQILSLTFAGKVFWSKVGYAGSAGVAVAGLVFVLHYAGFTDWVRPSRILGLAAFPLATQFFVWTNEHHGLIWRRLWLDHRGAFPMLARTHGPVFWLFLSYAYLLCLTSIVLLSREFLSRRGIYRSQTGVLLLGCLVPFIGNCLYAFGIELIPNLDITVFGFFITGITMAWGLFRFQLPLIMPLARQTVFEGISDGVIALDTAGNVVEVNPAAARLIGEPAQRLIGRPALSALRKHFELASICGLPQETRVQLTMDSPSGTPRHFDVRRTLLRTHKQQVVGSLIVLSDITEQQAAEEALRQAQAALEQRIAERTADLSRTIQELRQLEDQLTISATHDSLTQLPNRTLFLTRIEEQLLSPPFAVLYLDLDRFKIYNDGYGHQVGDLILCEMARRLKECLRPQDTVARMGGDEFTILLAAASHNDAQEQAQRCLHAIAQPARVASVEVQLTASIGVALAQDHQSSSAEDLVRDADLAMYRAKRQGGNRVEFFGEAMRTSALSLVQLQQDLRLAVERGQIEVFYQPFVRMATGHVVGFEALVRWRHPELGLLLPAQFIPIAEQTGVLMEIDEFVLHQACLQRSRWANLQSLDLAPFVTVNVAGWQFTHPERWWQAMANINPPAAGLRLEMMESVLVTNAHASAEFFDQVRAHNLEIYLDDFGTGYSSLSWLSHFPIRTLKIDRSFVQEIETEGRAASIVKAIIALASVLDMEVVAEGVESERQADLLLSLGCEVGQGFLFSRPIDGPASMAMLSRRPITKRATA